MRLHDRLDRVGAHEDDLDIAVVTVLRLEMMFRDFASWNPIVPTTPKALAELHSARSKMPGYSGCSSRAV